TTPFVRQFGDVVADGLGDADLVHFDCHGHASDPIRLRTSDDDSPLLQLTLAMVEGGKSLRRGRCVVFANACESDAPDLSLGQGRSFGWAFFTKGAVCFLGTLGKIPEKEALDFAERFYRALAGDADGNVEQAFQVARDAKEHPPVLVYCLYGNP